VHQHRGLGIVGLGQADFELGVRKFGGIPPPHPVDELEVEVRIAAQFARKHRLQLSVLDHRIDEILTTLLGVPSVAANSNQ